MNMLTINASRDNLTGDDYHDIYTELRQATSLDRLVALLGSQYSKAYWHKYEHGNAPLTRQMKQELRRGVGLPPLPPTVAEATAHIHPDAEIVQVGDGEVNRAILVGTPESLTICVNGGVTLFDANRPLAARVTEVTRAARKRLIRPIASTRQNERRAALGASWSAVIEAGLRVLEDNGE